MTLLRCSKITKTFGETDVLRGIDLELEEHDRVGLVGQNGAGKTTLANILCGSLQPDSGTITQCNKELTVGYLRQFTAYTGRIFENMFGTDSESNTMKTFLEISSHLGLTKTQEWNNQRLHGLSGGEKTKLALANVMATKPDLLILDEPTNHMDFHGIEWLIDELRQYHGTVLVISHDRYLLDKTVTRIFEIEEGTIQEYQGNYTYYRTEKQRQRDIQLHQYLEEQKQQAKIEAEIAQLDDWSYKAHTQARATAVKAGRVKGGKEFYRSKAKRMDRQVKSKIKRLERLRKESVQRPIDDPSVVFQLDSSGKRGKRVLEAMEIAKSFENRSLFSSSSFYVKRGDRVGIVGPNGCGKTTLVRMLLRDETVDTGQLWLSPSAKVAYISQDVIGLNETKTPLETFELTERSYRLRVLAVLRNMGFNNAMLRRPIGKLSLGERVRLKVAHVVLEEHDLLILDEPTNHLDLYSREKLEETLGSYGGTILLISHDRYMLEKVCTRMLVFEDGKISALEDGFRAYMKRQEQNSKQNHRLSRKERQENLMVVNNRIAYLLGQLNRYSTEDPEYAKLDKEFKQLVQRKRELSS